MAQQQTPPPKETPPPPPRQPTTAERFVLVIDGFKRGSAVPPAGTASVVADANNRIAKIAAKDPTAPQPVGQRGVQPDPSVQRARAVAGLADASDPGSARNRRAEIRSD